MIQVLESTKASATDCFRYISAVEADAMNDASLQGWWDEGYVEQKNNVEYPIGTAFLACFGSKNIAVNYAGQVPSSGETMDCVGKKYVMFANITPRKAKLGEFVLVGGNCDSDIVQILEPERASSIASYRYISEDEAIRMGNPSYQGWWDEGYGENMDNVEVDAGSGFLSCFGSENVSIVFPNSIK